MVESYVLDALSMLDSGRVVVCFSRSSVLVPSARFAGQTNIGGGLPSGLKSAAMYEAAPKHSSSILKADQ
jgi:hypothetical protein